MKIELYYHVRQYDWQDEPEIVISTNDMSEYCNDSILLKIIEIDAPEIVMPNREVIVKHKVAKLQEEKAKLQSDVQLKITVIEDKIRQLQYLESK